MEIHDEEPPAFAQVQELWWPTVFAFEEAAARDDVLAELLALPGEAVTLLVQAERFI